MHPDSPFRDRFRGAGTSRAYDGAVNATRVRGVTLPMAFGRARRRKLRDPIFEPLWGGNRALVTFAPAGDGRPPSDPVLTDEAGAEIAVTDELREALSGSLLVSSAVIDGYVVPGPFPDTTGVVAGLLDDSVMSSGAVTRRFFIGGGGRNERKETLAALAARTPRIEPDQAVGFVAVDLLEIDGASLLDVPLQERKRLLDSALADNGLVRRTVFVRAPVEPWYAQWRALGFREIAVKGANSRYAPGAKSDEWGIELLPVR